MGTGSTDEICKDVVRIAFDRAFSLCQVVDDSGVCLKTLNTLVNAHRGTDVVLTL